MQSLCFRTLCNDLVLSVSVLKDASLPMYIVHVSTASCVLAPVLQVSESTRAALAASSTDGRGSHETAGISGEETTGTG